MFEQSVSFIPSIWALVNSWFTPTVLFVFLNLMIGTIAITSSLTSNQKQKQQQPQQQYQEQQLPRSQSVLQRLKSINFYNYRSPEPDTNYAQTQDTDTHFSHHFNPEQERERGQQQDQQHQWSSSPSMLQRIKSINLYNYMTQESNTLDKPQEADTHYFPNQVHEEEHHQEAEKEAEQQQQQQEEEQQWKEEEKEEDRFQDQEQTLDEIYSQLQRGSNVGRSESDTKPASGELPKKLPQKMRKSASSKSAFSHFKEKDIVEVEARRPATVRELGNAKMTQVDDEGVDAKADDFINKFKHQLKLQRIDSIIRYKEMINRGAGK